jgi:hypothetical protein
MSFGVIITEKTAQAAQGVPVNTGTLFLTGISGGTPPAKPALCGSTTDFETAYATTRAGAGSQAMWDYLDIAFREGLTQAYVMGYAAAGGYTAALPLFDYRLGPGQVACVGEAAMGAPVYSALQSHGDGNNRIALLDGIVTDTAVANWTTNGAAAGALPNLENVGVFGSWATAPGPPGVATAGPRQVPASAVIAGLCSRVDQTGNPGRAAGGRDFPLQYCNGFLYDPNDTDRTTLFQNGVNMFANRWGTLENYGMVTPLFKGTPLTTTPFWQLNCARTRMAMKAQSQAIGENYYMRTLDGQGKLAAELGADLAAMCSDLYEADALFGDTPQDAYSVNVSASINTTATAATATLNGMVEARLSQYTNKVQITLVSVPVAGVVS